MGTREVWIEAVLEQSIVCNGSCDEGGSGLLCGSEITFGIAKQSQSAQLFSINTKTKRPMFTGYPVLTE